MDFKRIVAGTAVACIAFGLAGCSSDSGSGASSTTTTAKAAVCADKDALESSVRALSNVDLTGGKNAVTSAVDKVTKNLDALGESAKADLKPQVDDVKSAVTDLQTAVENLSDGSLTDNLQAVGNAIAKVGTTAGDLFGSLSSKCPSS
jgi:hypothetical protein